MRGAFTRIVDSRHKAICSLKKAGDLRFHWVKSLCDEMSSAKPSEAQRAEEGLLNPFFFQKGGRIKKKALLKGGVL